MPKLTAVLDACVLYPAPLRDLLMQLSVTDLFQARWTEDIHAEWIGNLLENRSDLTRSKLEHTRDLMNQNVRDCLVTGYHEIVPLLTLPDLKDRHVLRRRSPPAPTSLSRSISKIFQHPRWRLIKSRHSTQTSSLCVCWTCRRKQSSSRSSGSGSPFAIPLKLWRICWKHYIGKGW